MMKSPLWPLFLAVLPAVCNAAELTRVSDFGDNPAGLVMYTYVPDNLAPSPGVVLTLHGASGNGQQAFASTPYADLAEQYGFVVVYPESPQGAWDATSRQSIVRDGGGASQSIAAMARYAIDAHDADDSKVFVSGISSGGTMAVRRIFLEMAPLPSAEIRTNFGRDPLQSTMAGTYPDVFKGVVIYSAASRGDIGAMYPGYTGSYPQVQLYLGSEDRVIKPDSFNDTLAAWAQVLGYDATVDQVLDDAPAADWTTYVLGDKLQGIWAEGEGHPVFVQGAEDMKWWGFSR